MSSSKILPMQYPIITSWQWQANSFAVLGNYPETEPWIMNHFIQLQLTSNPGWISSYVDFHRTPTFEFCPWLFHQHLKRETVRFFNEDICSFFVDCINLNNYIYGVFDQAYFIQGHDRLPHDLFIYGYDLERQVFHAADFTFTGKYSFAEVPFEQLEKAYHAIEGDEDWLFSGKGGLSLISFNDSLGYDFNLSNLAEQMEGFLTGHNCFEKSREMTHRTNPCVYGLAVYDKLIENLIKIQDKEQGADYRPFHVLCDHKALMLRRIPFLERHGYLKPGTGVLERYQSLENDALLCRNLLIKYMVTEQSSIIDKIITKIRKIRNEEEEQIKILLSNLVIA
ncbi:hypothetical protein SAMN04487895_103397 [Paenibacillus sophorae]|uniref:Butirosin biosynthesis protein H, N-terminal n=1 Tax=Paenibacillus sophorae TaxID=1333845 RepID=A0A1H8KD63_9BACL|nr:hypothetical protein [Paenibacillus sophorae]QWU13708.1 hypothetical protein KP014_17145 [Paenibacillus sophorae]SEN90910.1 hypothetical protein SAMN04487895_103397 [Paenibacillus sophorae]